MASRWLRQHPHEFGRASTLVETIELAALEELSEKLLKAINYYGLVEVEYKPDPRDGQFKLLDINARTWGRVRSFSPVISPPILFAFN
jgi:D-aspartate ligase